MKFSAIAGALLASLSVSQAASSFHFTNSSAPAISSTESASSTASSASATSSLGPWIDGHFENGLPIFNVYIPTSLGSFTSIGFVSTYTGPNYEWVPQSAAIGGGPLGGPYSDVSGVPIDDETTPANADVTFDSLSSVIGFEVVRFTSPKTEITVPGSTSFRVAFAVTLYGGSFGKRDETFHVEYTLEVPVSSSGAASGASSVAASGVSSGAASAASSEESGAAGVTSVGKTITAASTLTSTLTSCSDGKCTESPATTAPETLTTTITSCGADGACVTVTSTYCPESATGTVKIAPETFTTTITSCADGACCSRNLHHHHYFLC
ncbi:unnamed protein product [[Candida] boidinii]|uniref:Unnamed protein product n=1 Tax=Candida boidinii TaxID=5477 RepID=A0A9W6WJU3_CANBO|nr:unnamed protein product [[Candida] boidinii]GMG17692.1 unnamed protein product [[Candida] boidinii]